MTIKIEVQAADPRELHHKLLELMKGSAQMKRVVEDAKRAGREEYIWRETAPATEAGVLDYDPVLLALAQGRDAADKAGSVSRMEAFAHTLRFLTRVLKDAS